MQYANGFNSINSCLILNRVRGGAYREQKWYNEVFPDKYLRSP